MPDTGLDTRLASFTEALAVHMDFETRSACDLKKSGVWVYANHPSTGIWTLKYRFGESGPMLTWKPGDPAPVDLLNHIRNGGKIVAHNAAFERTIWNTIVVGKMHADWPKIAIEQQDCTLARAAAIDHPQGLDMLGKVLELPVQKNMRGHALMQKMAKPRKALPNGEYEWWDDIWNVIELDDYCEDDVRVETLADAKIPPLTDSEREVWHLDQRINERGVHIDLYAVQRCAQLVELAKKRADQTMRALTGRDVKKVTSVAQIKDWLQSRGIDVTSLGKGEHESLLYLADLQDDKIARQVIELRKATGTSSTAKYKAMLQCVSETDARIRFLLQYHGAGPGRWAGRLVQPQNFKRVDYEEEGYQVDWLVELLHSPFTVQEIAECIDSVYGPLKCLQLLALSLRTMITAEHDAILFGGDFSNIEGRVVSWIANEQWKLDAFAAYDAGTGPDLYKLSYSRSFGVPIEQVGKGKKRQIGKVSELSLGYQGSVGAFINMGANYGVDVYELINPVYEASDPQQWQRTMESYASAQNKMGLQPKAWTACKIIVDNWRAAHPNIVQLWWDMQDAAVEAASNPGTVVTIPQGRISFYNDGRCMWMLLPSGRTLCYPSPRVKTTVEKIERADGSEYERIKHVVWFWGVDPDTRQWVERAMYGGLLTENAVQAIARDIMVDAMFRAEKAGYDLILTVHDELLAEVKKVWAVVAGLSEQHFAEIMAMKRDIYAGLPISVATWSGPRYNK